MGYMFKPIEKEFRYKYWPNFPAFLTLSCPLPLPPRFFLIIQWFLVEKDATISLIVVCRVALMVSWRVVVCSEEMRRTDERSNKKEEDELVNFPSLLSLESSTCGWTCKKQYFTAFSKSRSCLNKWWDPCLRFLQAYGNLTCILVCF